MRRILRAATLIVLAAFVLPEAGARDYSSLYDDAFLRQKAPRYRDDITWNLQNVFLPKLTPEERQKVQGVQIVVPLRGNSNGPMDFYATSSKTIVMPAMSVRFLAELSVAYAWLQAKGYSMETVTEYVSMLKYQDFAGRYPAPRVALQIPDDAEQDKLVDRNAQLIFNHSVVFILLHELGHVRYQHPGYGPGVSRPQARANEAQADAFALEVLRRAGQPVQGLPFFFLSAAYFVPHRGDFGSDAEYEASLARDTHPLTSDRVQRLSAFIRQHAADFGRLQSDPAAAAQTIRWTADAIDRDVVPVLADVDQQRLMAIRGRAVTLAGLQPRRPGELMAAPQRPSSTQSFDGVYDGEFTNNTGSIPIRTVLQRRGTHVTGRYTYGAAEGKIEGTIEGAVLTFIWREPGAEGSGVVRTTADGSRFAGTWGYGDDNSGGGRLTGRRSAR